MRKAGRAICPALPSGGYKNGLWDGLIVRPITQLRRGYLGKRKRKRRHRKSSPRKSDALVQRREDLEKAFEKADRLVTLGRAVEAIDLLERFLEAFPREADLHYRLGYTRAHAGDIWGAISGYQRAMKLERSPGYWPPLAFLYLEIELRAHALRAFRQVFRFKDGLSLTAKMLEEAHQIASALEVNITELARDLGIPTQRVEEGLYLMERGQQALQENNFPACIADNRKAIRYLGDWPPTHNNLSLALFFNGQPEEAVTTARRVLSHAPDNIHALANGIRFLAWTGRETEARELWGQLADHAPQDTIERIKIVEAAAMLGEDESVYQLLTPLDRRKRDGGRMVELAIRERLFLAVAEVNTGRHRLALRRFKSLQSDAPWAGDLLAALEAGRPGPGWAERFPYFHSSELLPAAELDKLIQLGMQQEEMPPQRFRNKMIRFVARFPQIVRIAEKMIWEEAQPEAGVVMLQTFGTPAAYTALRRFGLSQAGDDEIRMRALMALVEAGEIEPDEPVHIWNQGEWREVLVRGYEISDERSSDYDPDAIDLLVKGHEAFSDGEHELAEQCFQRALELEPRAKEAYNNLGTIYARLEQHDLAKGMFQKALTIDPLYVFPRCNLASYLVDEEDIKGAQDALKPLSDVTQFHPQEMAFYSYTQARIHAHLEEYEAARRALEIALEIWPDYELAKDMLEWLDAVESFDSRLSSLWERQHQRALARRMRLQSKLTTAAPSFSEALPLYSKDALTGMGRVVIPWGGWSAFRKAELIQEIIKALTASELVGHVVSELSDDERAALRQVFAAGGTMVWRDFDKVYGNDLEESRYWNWHEPETTMGRLRQRGLLVETTVENELLVAIPSDLRPLLEEILGKVTSIDG